ncbi:MAG: glutamine--fructose-6-phosphate transaminase (isomerizing) [Proteobacteria bacterium]|jgi:glucosamine--fructose-6-phosphate aminotransferase (isomerizing)|nr:glutamine--fructose-6-phosphate transaminase (isomerizing) [Alphaproteobacteria bacterium]NCC02598.1 glutamine--fructose-6-phosphate transaminase (isomerizing) [Pseudomonadota bacterium]
MCGIVGMIAQRPVVDILVDGLKRLEYRGYDSAGVATLVNGQLETRRAVGKLNALVEKLQREPLGGMVGIGHTRWATHGKPSENNAHPHFSSQVAVVHNGIIENYNDLRKELEANGHVFKSETDTESIAHLITDFLNKGLTPQAATAQALKKLEGAFALAIIFTGHNDLLIGARRGSPLAIGYGSHEMYLGSDALALAPLSNRISYLEEGDWAELTLDGAVVHDESGAIVERKVHETALSGAMIGKGEYRHFMLKEIFEQPTVIGDTMSAMIGNDDEIILPHLPFEWSDISRLTLVACGTAYYAGCVAKYWFEQLANLPVELDIASEFRYRQSPMAENGVMIVISQSGETADTLAALNYAKKHGQKIMAVVNVQHSTIARQSDCMVPTLCGPEISVASTKGFSTQLTVLLCLAIAAGKARGVLSQDKVLELIQALREVPARINDVLREDHKIQELAQQIMDAKDMLYLGRGLLYPIALEGALKIKEISYIHAEGYAAGELKHGPIALIDDAMPVVVISPYDGLFEKTTSNVQEVVARGGKVILFTDKKGKSQLVASPYWTMELPDVHPTVMPILYAIPVQLLAYYTALAKGTDVDQPRNLAKSVTVE